MPSPRDPAVVHRPVERPLLAGTLALAVGMGIGRFAFTPILPAMRDAFALTPSALAILAAANYLGYLVGAVVATAPVPPHAHRPLLRTSLLVVVGTNAVMAATTQPIVWALLRFLAGLASAAVLVFGSALVLSWLGQHGRLDRSGWFFSGVGLGIASSGLVLLMLPRFDGAARWRTEWVAVALLAGALALPSWRWLPASDGGAEVSSAPGPDRHAEQGRLPVVLLGAAYFLAGAGYIVAGTFLVAIVAALPQLAGLGVGIWILVGLAAAPSTVLWAWIARRRGASPALVAAYLAQAGGLALPALSPHAVAAAGSALLFGGSFMGIAALTLGEARRWAPRRRAARTIGVLTALFALGQVVGPLLAAALADARGDFRPALLVAAGAVGLGALLTLGVGIAAGRHHPQAACMGEADRSASGG